MDVSQAVMVLRGAILQIMILSAHVLLTALAVGLVISILQATTSIQEKTLTFVPKIAAILIVLLLLGGWMITTLRGYTVNLFGLISEMRD